jgi:predicted PurR-regulated permease PerM
MQQATEGEVAVVNGHLDGIFYILINAFILYYIYRPYVKSFFGKTTTTTTSLRVIICVLFSFSVIVYVLVLLLMTTA